MPEITYKKGGKRSGFIMTLLCLALLFDYADRMIIASIFPYLKKEWLLSDMSLGSLTGIVSLFIAIFALPLAFLVDRWSRRKMIALMVFFWSLATLACAFVSNYNQLLVARALTGLGEAAYAPAAIAMIAAIYSGKIRAQMTGIWDAFAPIGSGIGFILGGYISFHYGWRSAMGVVAIPGIILAILLWFIKDYKTVSIRDSADFAKKRITQFIDPIKGLFKIPTLWYVYFAFAMNFAINTAVITWLPSYFVRFFDLTKHEADLYAGGLAFLVLIGAPLGGFVADQLRTRIPTARVLVSEISSLASVVLFLFAVLFPHSPTFVPFIVLFGIFSAAFVAPGSAIIQSVVHPGTRAIAYGVNVLILNALGAFWAPIAIGRLSDLIGLDTAFLFLPVLGVIAALLFYLASKSYLHDLEKVKHVILVEEA